MADEELPSARSTPAEVQEAPWAPAADLVAAAEKLAALIVRDPPQVGPGLSNIKEFSIFQHACSADSEELVKLARLDHRAERAMGAMVGLAIADSVGHNFEFVPVGRKGHHFDPETLEVVGAKNKFELKPGQWTDDTSMALCIADSLLVQGAYCGSDIRVRFWNWWNRGYNNAFRLDSTRSQSVGLGSNSEVALFAVHGPHPPARYEAESEDSGNGCLMRLAPLPLFYYPDEDMVVQVSRESSHTTHPGSCAADACGFLGFAIHRALARSSADEDTAAMFLESCATRYLERIASEEQVLLKKLLQSGEPPGSTERCWNWRDPDGPFLRETLAARGASYNGYPVSAGYFGAYCMDGLAIALHSMYHTDTFMAALARCVNLLGDADSTGAICGQIAGAFYGLSAIDSRLVEQLNLWDSGEIALRAATLYALQAEPPRPPYLPTADEDIDSCYTDPAMPELLPVSARGNATSVTSASPPPRSLLDLASESAADHAAHLGPSATPEDALTAAKELLAPPSGPVFAADAKRQKLHAVHRLQEAVKLGVAAGNDSIVEAAAVELMAMLKNTDKTLLTPAIDALNLCSKFPSSLVPEATKLLMQKRAWPFGGDALLQLCGAIGTADPAGMLSACIELVPRVRAPQMLGFSSLLQSMVTTLTVEHSSEIEQMVVLLCDDMGGPAARMSSAKSMLRNMAASIGRDVLARETEDAGLSRIARRVNVQERLNLALSE